MKELDPRFRKNAPAPAHLILAFEAELGWSLPISYKEFLAIANGGEGSIGENGYLEVWPVESLHEFRTKYEVDKYAPRVLPIGSNGGGEILAIRFCGNAADFGFLPFLDLQEASFLEIASDFWNALSKIGMGKAFDT